MEWPPLEDITLSYHTLAGNQHGEPPKYSLRERAAAALKAGIRSVGWCGMDFTTWDQVRDDAAWLHDHGMRASEGEWLEMSKPVDYVEESVVFRMGQIFGADRINVGYCSPELGGMGNLVKRTRFTAQRAADYGQTLAFESVAFGAYWDMRQVELLIMEAGEPNLGTLADIWQIARTRWHADGDQSADIIPSMVKGIQLAGLSFKSDWPWPSGLFHEAQCERRLPDEGDYDVRGWLAKLIGAGVNASVACEVISDELRGMSLDEAAEAVAASLGNLLATQPYVVRPAQPGPGELKVTIPYRKERVMEITEG